MQDQNNLIYFKNAMILFVGWMFGFKLVFSLTQFYKTFYNMTTLNLFKSFFLLTWIIAGFSNSLIYLLTTSIYLAIYYNQFVINMYKSTVDAILELNQVPRDELSNENKTVMKYYDMFSNVSTYLQNLSVNTYNRVMSYRYVNMVISGLQFVAYFASKINWYNYISFVDNLIKNMVNYLISFMSRFSVVKNLMNRNINSKELQLTENKYTEKSSENSTMDMQKKIKDDLNKLEQMFGKIDGPINMPPPDFANLPPPTEEEMKQMNDMMKMFVDMDNFIKKNNPTTISNQQKKNGEEMDKILASFKQINSKKTD